LIVFAGWTRCATSLIVAPIRTVTVAVVVIPGDA
jgi:hypothetical protein